MERELNKKRKIKRKIMTKMRLSEIRMTMAWTRTKRTTRI